MSKLFAIQKEEFMNDGGERRKMKRKSLKRRFNRLYPIKPETRWENEMQIQYSLAEHKTSTSVVIKNDMGWVDDDDKFDSILRPVNDVWMFYWILHQY